MSKKYYKDVETDLKKIEDEVRERLDNMKINNTNDKTTLERDMISSSSIHNDENPLDIAREMIDFATEISELPEHWFGEYEREYDIDENNIVTLDTIKYTYYTKYSETEVYKIRNKFFDNNFKDKLYSYFRVPKNRWCNETFEEFKNGKIDADTMREKMWKKYEEMING